MAYTDVWPTETDGVN